MAAFFRQLFLGRRFYSALGGLAVVFLLSYWFWPLYPLAIFLTCLLAGGFLGDLILLFGRYGTLDAHRILPERFSNGDANEVGVCMTNNYPFALKIFILDEIPEQFQKRDFGYELKLKARETVQSTYSLSPKHRGEYRFGSLHIFASARLGFIIRRFSFDSNQVVKVYPSFLQMRKYEFLAFNAVKKEYGPKSLPKLGHSREFEQIKPYVVGDDLRNLNWKAAAKTGKLMTNHFQEEKAQPVYAIIDLGRVMKMPFNGLSLLDYAINSSLAFSNIALKNRDKAGIATFSSNMGPTCEAQHRPTQLATIMDVLYNIQTGFPESDFGTLYSWVRRKIGQKSLLIIYTNFEHVGGMRRQLPYLKAMAKHHVVLLVFFENHELQEFSEQAASSISEIVEKTIAAKSVYDKRLIALELNKNGIQTILCPPQSLSVQTINKYLEIKSKGLI